jgi:hypothetical protein
MDNKRASVVNLPNLKPTVKLPLALATTLEHILSAPPCGISTPELQQAGIISVHNNIAELKKRGAVIHAEKRYFTDRFGRRLPRVAHYSYKGWIDQSLEKEA